MRRHTVFLALLLLLLAVLPGVMAQDDGPTDPNAENQALRLILHARAIRDDDPRTAALLAIRALRLAELPEAMAILTETLPMIPARLLPEEGWYFTQAAFIDGDALGLDGPHSVRRFDLDSNEVIYTLDGPPEAATPHEPRAFALSPDESLVAVSDNESEVHLYDAATGEHLRQIELPTDRSYTEMQFSADGTRLLVLGGQRMRLYDLLADELALEIQVDAPLRMNSIALSPDGTLIASDAGTHNEIWLWDAATGEQVATLTGHANFVADLAFSADGSRLISGSADGTARVWRMDRLETDYLITLPESERVHHVGFVSDDVAETFIGTYGTLYIYSEWRQQARYGIYDGYGAMALDDASDTLLASVTGGLGVFPMTSGLEDSRLRVDVRSITTYAPLPEGGAVIGYSQLDANGELIYGLRRLDAPTGATVWDQPTGGATLAVPSPDGRYIVSGYYSGNRDANDTSFDLLLHDAATGEVLRHFDGHEAQVDAVAFSPDGSRLFSTAQDLPDSMTGGGIRAWNVATGERLWSIRTRAANDIAVRPDEGALAVASLSVSFYDPMTGEPLPGSLETDGTGFGDVYRVAYSPDGSLLLAAHDDRVLRLYDAGTLELRYAWPATDFLFSMDIAFSPDGRYAAANDRSGQVMVMSTLNGRELLRLTDPTVRVYHVDFTADSTSLVTVGDDQQIRTWPLDLATVVKRACARLGDADLSPVQRLRYGVDERTPTCP